MPTIADVAKLAGVSPGTVSRVMNGADNVRPDTRARVEEAIANLGYYPNFQARSLRNKRTSTIGLAIPELTNYFWTSIARGVQDAAQEQGYHVFICNTNGRRTQSPRYLDLMMSRVDGAILSRRSEKSMIAPNRIPVVFIGQSQAAHWNVDSVYSDSISGAFALTQHLIHLGHRQIGIITGRQSSSSASERVAGYCFALAEAGLSVDRAMIYWGEYDREWAKRFTLELLEQHPTAIVAANNEICIGVMNALDSQHISVPQSMAVVCFDDFYPDSRFAATMTVASQSPYDLGINATQLLLSRLNKEDEYLRPQTVLLPTRLIVRHSCGGGQPASPDLNPVFDRVEGQLIPSLSRQKILSLAARVQTFESLEFSVNGAHLMQRDRTQVTALKRAIRGEATATPLFECALNSRTLYRYVLEREPDYEFVDQTTCVSPEDQIEFAQRVGIAAVPCRFVGRFSSFEFPALTDQLDFFDRYVRAARNSNVGVAADFRCLFEDTLDIHRRTSTMAMGEVADNLLQYQSKVVQLICDRFADDLTFVLFSDHLADEDGLQIPVETFEAVFSERIRQLMRPVKEHGLPTVLYTPGNLKNTLPLISKLGFDGVYVAQPECNDLTELQKIADGKLSFMGGIPTSVLLGSQAAIEQQIRSVRGLFGQAYVAGIAGEINDSIPTENYFAFLRAVRTFEN
jgi:LacI family transcriptional regulator